MTGRDNRDQAEPLDRNRIVELLAMLDRRLRDLDLSASLYVVGGAAVAVTVADRRVTRDVDVAHLDPAVSAEAQALASVEGLPANWLNAAAAPWIPAAPTPADAAGGPGLTIRYAPPEHLLAMKMVALRQQDAPDIAALAARLGLDRFEQFAAVLRSVYAGEGVLQQILGVPDGQLDSEVDAIARRVSDYIARAAAADE